RSIGNTLYPSNQHPPLASFRFNSHLEVGGAFQRGQVCQQIVPRLPLELVGFLGALAIVVSSPFRQLQIPKQAQHHRVGGLLVGTQPAAQVASVGTLPPADLFRGEFAHVRAPWIHLSNSSAVRGGAPTVSHGGCSRVCQRWLSLRFCHLW